MYQSQEPSQEAGDSAAGLAHSIPGGRGAPTADTPQSRLAPWGEEGGEASVPHLAVQGLPAGAQQTHADGEQGPGLSVSQQRRVTRADDEPSASGGMPPPLRLPQEVLANPLAVRRGDMGWVHAQCNCHGVHTMRAVQSHIMPCVLACVLTFHHLEEQSVVVT